MPKPNGAAVRFTALRVANWRNFGLAEMALEERAFLVGPNASGKSNLLDVFRFLRDIVSVGGGFQDSVQRPGRDGVSRLRALSARKHSDVEIHIAVGTSSDRSMWEYSLAFNQDNRRRPMIKRETVRRSGEPLLSRPDANDQADPERLTQTHLEQVTENRDYRALVEFLGTVSYMHVVPQLVREPDRSIGRVGDPFGGDFLERLASTPARTRDARLRRIRDALRVAVPQLVDLELWRDQRGAPHVRGKYHHWRASGAWQGEEQFSDGTLRLLGLLWSVLDGSGPLLLEEPELSLHPGVVRHLPSMFARAQRASHRQILASTHSPDLLLDAGIGLDEVFLLIPSDEGTHVRSASTFSDIPKLLSAGITLPEAVLPLTEPGNAMQLALFGR